MDNGIPRMDKTRLKVSSLNDIREEKQYWLSQKQVDRLNAIEINRRMVYGTNRTSSRLQRLLEIADLQRS